MAIIGVPAINAPGIAVDLTRSLPVRDPSLVGVANSGVRWLSEFAFPWCYPGGSPIGRPNAGAPANGATVYDMAERANGSVSYTAGTITYAGGGIDLTNSQSTGVAGAARNAGLILPASVLSDIWTPYGGKSQRYLFSTWVKLPTLANWNSTGTLLSMAGDLAYNTGSPSLFVLSQQTGGILNLRRQIALNTYDTTNALNLIPASADYGSVVQLGVWRTDTQQGLRLRSANGTITVTSAVGSDNTQDFSANTFCVGRNGASFGGASATAVLTALSGVRVYRAYMENLARSGRDPVTVLDAAYAAVVARNPFS